MEQSGITMEDRRRVAADFARRHNGVFLPHLFVQEVAAAGPSHPAYRWFEWDDSVAAGQLRLKQARDFVRGIVVEFRVHELTTSPSISVAVSSPAYLSHVDGRTKGGGYRAFRPDDPESVDELTRQAAASLESFCRRYKAAFVSRNRMDAFYAIENVASELRLSVQRHAPEEDDE